MEHHLYLISYWFLAKKKSRSFWPIQYIVGYCLSSTFVYDGSCSQSTIACLLKWNSQCMSMTAAWGKYKYRSVKTTQSEGEASKIHGGGL